MYIQDNEGENDDCLHILNIYEKENNKMLIKGIGLENDSKFNNMEVIMINSKAFDGKEQQDILAIKNRTSLRTLEFRLQFLSKLSLWSAKG